MKNHVFYLSLPLFSVRRRGLPPHNLLFEKLCSNPDSSNG